jgi:hypothetical protein
MLHYRWLLQVNADKIPSKQNFLAQAQNKAKAKECRSNQRDEEKRQKVRINSPKELKTYSKAPKRDEDEKRK